MLLRPATAADGPAFVALVRALAEFEKLAGPDEAAAARLVADFTATPPRYELMVAEKDGELVAYAAHFMTYSTFRARPTLFLEDLFVHPRARRQGIARAMLDRLRALAEERGCGRFEWFVLDWNEDAQKLYQQVGAKQIPSWVLCRVDLADKIAG